MAVNTITLPHGTIPTQMFGNSNLQTAMTYVNENFASVKDGVNEAISSFNATVDGKADADHSHDSYSLADHTHTIDTVIGLQSALDDKAALNHEHSQYLTDLPAHTHVTSAIYGLEQSLAQKADASHTHALSQVDGLATELGNKASGAYVDQKVNSLGTTIVPLAKQTVEIYAADNSAVSNTPVDVASAQANETDAQKKARIGTSLEYARSDHKHVFSQSAGDSPTAVGGANPFPNDTSEETETGTILWQSGGENGATVVMLFKGGDATIGIDLVACKLTISKIGTITKIEAIKEGGINLPI